MAACEIGKRLKRARRRRKLSRVELAKLIGVTRGAIYNYETDAREPRNETLVKLADVLHTTVGELYGEAA